MELAGYKACICEGAAERAIMDILLDNNLLIFPREEMLEEEVIRCRDGKRFEQCENWNEKNSITQIWPFLIFHIGVIRIIYGDVYFCLNTYHFFIK